MDEDKKYAKDLEGVLHSLYINREVCLNEKKVIKILELIGEWSYWSSNGELTDEQRKKTVDACFEDIKKECNLI